MNLLFFSCCRPDLNQEHGRCSGAFKPSLHRGPHQNRAPCTFFPPGLHMPGGEGNLDWDHGVCVYVPIHYPNPHSPYAIKCCSLIAKNIYIAIYKKAHQGPRADESHISLGTLSVCIRLQPFSALQAGSCA